MNGLQATTSMNAFACWQPTQSFRRERDKTNLYDTELCDLSIELRTCTALNDDSRELTIAFIPNAIREELC